jgi:O-antigen/teichoic acid export membrane protein
VFIGSILAFVNARIDNLLVAGVLGPTAMSFYGMAWNASRMPIVILHQALGVVLVPAVARMQSASRPMELMLRDSLRHAYLLLAPLIAFLYVSGPSLVVSILGAKWLPLVPSLRIMLVTVLVGPVFTVSHSLLIGTGRQHLPGMASVGQFVVVVGLVVPLARNWGLVGAAAADAVSAGVFTVGLLTMARLARPDIRLGILRAVALPIPGACVAGFVAERIGNAMPVGPIRLVCEASAVFTSYLIVLALFGGRENLAEVGAFLKGIVTHRPTPAASSSRLI